MSYNRGDTVYITYKFETYTYSTETWAVADADTGYPKVTIVDYAGTTKVDAVAMTNVATGRYEYQYQLAADAVLGKWYVKVQGCKGGYYRIDSTTFEVVA